MVPSGEPRKKLPVTPPGIDSGTVRLVAQCLNHYATPGPHYIDNTFMKFQVQRTGIERTSGYIKPR